MFDILLFAGTTEGRTLAGYLRGTDLSVCVFTATGYGGDLIGDDGEISGRFQVHKGRLDARAIDGLLRANPGSVVIDATHPYADRVSAILREAAEKRGCDLIRTQRKEETVPDEAVLFDSIKDTVSYLAGTRGNILVTTGSKELKEFCALPDYKNRVYARVLSLPSVAETCGKLGFQGTHLICMQGPFSKEMNLACIHMTNARWLVTKESGREGGFREKADAALEAGCGLAVIRRPAGDSGISVQACVDELKRRFPGHSFPDNPILRDAYTSDEEAVRSKENAAFMGRTVALIGVGCGDDITLEAAGFLKRADLVIGASRLLSQTGRFTDGARKIKEYRPAPIREIVTSEKDAERIAVLFSGDSSFFSGASAVREALKDCKANVVTMPGISSVSAFAAKIGVRTDGASLISIHGRTGNPVGSIAANSRVFCLLGKEDDASALCRDLIRFGLGDVNVALGECLGSENERIRTGRPENFTDARNDRTAVLFAENPSPDPAVSSGIPDNAFIRGAVPMTKEEVRTVSVSKLQLHRDSIVYDIGAGTGSVSVEIARLCRDGHVYAIERNREAAELIRKNAARFCTPNLTVIEGESPEALKDLPAPDRIFVGGGGKNLGQIIRVVRDKNSKVRVVLNAVTLETISHVMQVFDDEGIEPETVQISVARAKKAGTFHLMTAQNPVWIVTADFSGSAADSARETDNTDR